MTKKDYIKIARVLQETRASRLTLAAMAKMLAEDNPRFDSNKFIEAVEQKKELA